MLIHPSSASIAKQKVRPATSSREEERTKRTGNLAGTGGGGRATTPEVASVRCLRHTLA